MVDDDIVDLDAVGEAQLGVASAGVIEDAGQVLAVEVGGGFAPELLQIGAGGGQSGQRIDERTRARNEGQAFQVIEISPDSDTVLHLLPANVVMASCAAIQGEGAYSRMFLGKFYQKFFVGLSLSYFNVPPKGIVSTERVPALADAHALAQLWQTKREPDFQAQLVWKY